MLNFLYVAVSWVLLRWHQLLGAIGLDPQSSVQISLGSSGVPETFVVDGKGVIRHQYIGPLTAANVPGVIAELRALR